MRKIIAILLMITLVGSLSVAYADTGAVTFEDKNLESAIKQFFKENYHEYYDGNGALTKEIMEQIQIIVIKEDKGITSLAGLEQAKNIEGIWIQNNNIKDLSPLRGLNKLNSLVLSNNNIESINTLKDLSELQVLYINDNKITDMSPLKELNKLETLVISNNNISDISALEGKTELRAFESYDNNKIKDLSPLKESFKLEFLVITSSDVSDISVLEDKVNLNHLAIIDSNIENVKPLKNLKNLRVLFLTKNSIKDISPLLPFDRFEILNINDNPLWENDGTNSKLGDVTGEKSKSNINDNPVYEVWSEPAAKVVMTEGNIENKTDNSALPIIAATIGGLFIVLFIVMNNKNLKIYAVEDSNDTWGVRILGKRKIKVHSDEISIDISKELSEIENERLKVEFISSLALKVLNKKIIFIKDNNSFGEITLTKLAKVIEITKDGEIIAGKK